MSSILIVGAGLAGLSAALLLARSGHRVTVLEQDAASGRRRGLQQLPHIHLNLALWRELAERELPELPHSLLTNGALRLNLLAANPPLNGEVLTEADRRFETVTARRSLQQRVLEDLAGAAPGVSIRWGEQVQEVIVAETGEPACVLGVRTRSGAEFRADLTVDASGRRSALPQWLARARLPAAREERAERGSVYYSRHYRSGGAQLPDLLAGTLQPYHGLSIITLPADNDTWSVAIVTGSDDTLLRRLRDPANWELVLRQYPRAAHWLQGEPLTDEVAVMAALHDQNRSLLSDGGQPLTGGLVLLGDAWASTDPTLGRGTSITLRHALLLRDLLNEIDPGSEPLRFTREFEALSQRELGPLISRSNWYIRQRLQELHADVSGERVVFDADWQRVQASRQLELTDPDLARHFAGGAYLLDEGTEQFRRPELLDTRIREVLAAGWERYPLGGPTHQQLARLLS